MSAHTFFPGAVLEGFRELLRNRKNISAAALTKEVTVGRAPVFRGFNRAIPLEGDA